MIKLRKIDNELREESITKMLENIKFIEQIPRENLVCTENENRLTICNYSQKENLTFNILEKKLKENHLNHGTSSLN